MTAARKERILVTVKTYPTLSRKYGETVCTAGVREDGSWVRIYPVPFRRLGEREQYRKFDWIECQLARNTSDPRPESFRPYDQDELSDLLPAGHIDTSGKWRERRRILLDNARVYDRLDEIIDAAKQNELSLCVFKPTRVRELIWEQEQRDWDPKRLEEMRSFHGQQGLFEDNEWRRTFRLLPKLPYSFSYRFNDATGKESTLQILDWEIGALYWNCLRAAEGDEDQALLKVFEKYFETFLATDLHFFLGTTQQWHAVAPNPWVIIGVFPVPHSNQPSLL